MREPSGQWRTAKDPDLRPPLPGLPGFPGMRGFAALDTALRDVGFRHVADLLRAPAVQGAAAAIAAALPGGVTDDGFRVLDGLWFPGRGNLWRRVDLGYVRDCQARWRAAADDPRGSAAARIVDTLETVLRDDRMGLRRLLLWQLGRLLVDGPDGPTAAAATALGVHGSEAALLAAAVAAHFPPAGKARQAAETINEVWPGDRPRTALALARDLSPDLDRTDDHVLARLLAGLRARDAQVDLLIAAARRLDQGGDRRAGAAAWLRAVRLAADDDTALTGLLHAAAALADDPGTPAQARVRAEPGARTVQLAWSTAPRHTVEVTYRVLRFPEAGDEQAAQAERAGQPTGQVREVRSPDAASTAGDMDVPLGVPLRYAVLPLRRGRIAGVPRVTASLLLAPDVADVHVAPVPGGLGLSWRANPFAVAFRAVRTSRDRLSAEVEVACDRIGLVDRLLPPGTYDYRITCGYRGKGGRLVWSAGRRVTGTAVQWPTPVTELTVRGAEAGGPLEFTWRAPEHGAARVVSWPAPVAPGTDVSEQVTRLASDPVDTVPPPRTRARLGAVSTLGDLAVAGSSVVVEHPDVVEELTVQRVGVARAEVQFRWPEPAVLVLVEWEQDGRGRQARRVARSSFLADGMAAISVLGGECVVTVTPVPRPDAVVVAVRPARAVLAALPAARWTRPGPAWWTLPVRPLARWSWWRRWRSPRQP